MLYVYTPYRSQNDLPLFDTALPDLNLVELFRTNRYVGADRVGDEDQVSVGATSRLLDAKDGTQFLAATLGQIYYFKAPRVLLPDELPETSGSSDMVAQLALYGLQALERESRPGMGSQDPCGRAHRGECAVPSGARTGAELTYRLQRDRLKQIEAPEHGPSATNGTCTVAWCTRCSMKRCSISLPGLSTAHAAGG